MKVLPTSLDGVLIIEPDVFKDKRGFFSETYHKDRYSEKYIFFKELKALSFHLEPEASALFLILI